MSESVLVALIGAAALIIQTWMMRGRRADVKATRKAAEKAVDQTAATGNGFARKTLTQLQQLHTSVGAVHRRLDHQKQATEERDTFLNELLTNLDNRLTSIEETLT